MGTSTMRFNILIKREASYFLAHCLELDLVTTASSVDQVEQDIIDLIEAAVDYAFSNNNLEYLYHPAPPEIWKEFFACKNHEEKTSAIEPQPQEDGEQRFVPPWLIAHICTSGDPNHA